MHVLSWMGVARSRPIVVFSTVAVLTAGLVSPTLAQQNDPDVGSGGSEVSDLRIGVLAVADTIAALGRHPELAEPLPFTDYSLADALRLDDVVSAELIEAMAGTDLGEALGKVPGIEVEELADDGSGVTFSYSQTVEVPLALKYDDGDLRLGLNDGAGMLTVTLETVASATPPTDPKDDPRFVMVVDADQEDPLLRFALVSEPELLLTVSVDAPALAPFEARQGFTELDVVGGHYRIGRSAEVTLRDPNGRGLLTLEDLRYSTLVDLFRVIRTLDEVDIAMQVELPDAIEVVGATDPEPSSGWLTLIRTVPDGSEPPEAVWPDPTTAKRSYGSALAALTGISAVEGITAFAEYTGAALAIQNTGDVDIPNLGGSLADVFAPADQLLEILATTAVAEIRCGLTPTNPPVGAGTPGDTVYCDAVTAAGIADEDIVSVRWEPADTVILPENGEGADPITVGSLPSATVQVDGSDGEPDLTVVITMDDGQVLTARTLPRTVQAITGRIDEIGADGMAGVASAAVNLDTDQLEVAVQLSADDHAASLGVGDPAALGALVGLTGLASGDTDSPAEVPVSVDAASFDVGFGVSFDPERSVALLPVDETLLFVGDMAAGQVADPLTNLDGRIGFLGVSVDVIDLSVGTTVGANFAVSVAAAEGAAPIPVGDLFGADGTLAPDILHLASNLTAGITFQATEQPLDDGYVTGDAAAVGRVAVEWGPDGFPTVAFEDYEKLRLFDPVRAEFLRGIAEVELKEVVLDDGSSVDLEVASIRLDGTDLYTTFGIDAPTEQARRLIGRGVGCQSITVLTEHTLTCEGLAPNGAAAVVEGEPVEFIVMGDPYFLRDAIIEGFARTLNDFEWLTGDNVGDFENDQLTSTLPMIDVRPRQLAPERNVLAGGIRALVAAATEDESGDGEAYGPVSSAQAMNATVPTLMAGADLAFAWSGESAAQQLGLTLELTGNGSEPVPLRFFAPDAPLAGQVLGDPLPEAADSGLQVTVDFASTTVLELDVDSTQALVTTGDLTSTTSTATVDAGDLAGTVRAGIATAEITGGTALLGIEILTQYDPTLTNPIPFTTSRSGLLDADPSGADLTLQVTSGTETVDVHYAWEATDTSGGEGVVADTPEPMQVRYLAEGMAGLADAFEVALDGGDPRTAAKDGAPISAPLIGTPISAPLIGTDLDAGAGVAGALRDLLGDLRAGLAGANPASAEELRTLLANVFEVDAEHVFVDCGTTDTDDDDCVDLPATTNPEAPADPAGPDEWERVAVDLTVTGSTTLAPNHAGALAFSAGLDGLAVRSNATIGTTTDWTLPITLELRRGIGPLASVGDEGLALAIKAEMPTTVSHGADVAPSMFEGHDTICDQDFCMPAIVGYLPALLVATGDGGTLETTVQVKPLGTDAYTVLELGDGRLELSTGFAPYVNPDTGLESAETGLTLDFVTKASDYGSFDLLGTINVPWTSDGFGEVTYEQVRLDLGEVMAKLATPFAKADPYLGPARDVVNVLRTPIPVVSDLSELGGAGEVTLLSLLDKLAQKANQEQTDPGGKKKANPLELAYNIITFIEGVAKVTAAIAPYADQEGVLLEDLKASGALLTIEPRDLVLRESCTETVRAVTIEETVATVPDEGEPSNGDPPKPKFGYDKETAKCPDEATTTGMQPLDLSVQRNGKRWDAEAKAKFNVAVSQTTSSVTASMPGFSLPFLNDPDQLIDVLTGEGEATYFRLDLGTLGAQVAYSVKFPIIPVGPVPIQPFVGGSIGIEGRLAFGFDSMPQTLAVKSLDDPGDVSTLLATLGNFDGGDILREGFYIDDLDSDGVDVPEIKLVAAIEAGAGVSIGIVSAGIKGGVTLIVNLDLNDPDDDGRLRVAEIIALGENPKCMFVISADLWAFLKFFFEIDLFFTSFGAEFYIVNLGPYQLFRYACGDEPPEDLVAWNDGRLKLNTPQGEDTEFEVRQFDTAGGFDQPADPDGPDPQTVFEVSARGLVQRVEITRNPDSTNTTDRYTVTIFKVSTALPTEVAWNGDVGEVAFGADGGAKVDEWSFLAGETYTDENILESTPFRVPVTASGGAGKDIIVTGDGDDVIRGGPDDDTIVAGAGNDLVYGEDGNDSLAGGPGLDDLTGGAGDDKLQGGPGPDRLNGADGKDVLVGGPGRDVDAEIDVSAVVGSAEQDAEAARQVNAGFDSGDVLIGGAGDDVVDGAHGSDIVIGGPDPIADQPLAGLFGAGTRMVNIKRTPFGSETLVVAVQTAVVPGDAALDDLCESGTPPEGQPAAGTGDKDVVTGGPERDIVVGSDGPDQLTGGRGPDEICGRSGDDLIVGDDSTAAEEDSSVPGIGLGDGDIIRGGHGHDRIDAGPGDDLVFGDDTRLFRYTDDDEGVRVRDGTLGADSDGDGDDYVDAGTGNDIVAGGRGSDLLLGGLGDDMIAGEGRDDPGDGENVPSLEDRIVDCRPLTRIVRGHVDLNGDLLAEGDVEGVVADNGQMAGLSVLQGVVQAPDGTGPFTGLVGGSVVVVNGLVDLDRDGVVGVSTASGGATEDTGLVALASMLGTTDNNPDGDCLLGDDGADALLGGLGSDYAAGGPGTDLALGDAGHDLLLGDAGVDVLVGGPDDDVLVGGEGDDHLAGQAGDDRLRGNEGDDDLVGGSALSGVADGQDVLLGGRNNDVLAGENAALVSASILEAVAQAAWLNGGFDLPSSVLAGAPQPEASAVRCGGEISERWVTLLPGDEEDGDPLTPSDPRFDWYDELYGGFGCDWVFGQEGDDLVRGGQNEDIVEGGPGNDTGFGDGGDDIVVGGSSVNVAVSGAIVVGRSGVGAVDGRDLLLGDGGPDGIGGSDVLIGDNGTPTWAAGPGTDNAVTLAAGSSDGLGAADDILIGDGSLEGLVLTGDSGALSWCDALGGDTSTGSRDYLFGQAGQDCLAGGGGGDYLEGGPGDDRLAGGLGDDDIVGGSSESSGNVMGDDQRRLRQSLDRDANPTGLVDASAAGVPDGDDRIAGGAGADVVLGDNGRITRPDGALFDPLYPVRHVAMADTAAGATSGSDAVFGGSGNDVLYGQLDESEPAVLGSGDRLFGEDGNDVVIGDLAVVVLTPAGSLGAPQTLTLKGTAISEPVYQAGTIVPVTHADATLAQAGGADVGSGGPGDDVLRMGAGNDVASGDEGLDVLFGALGDDALWGGPDRDRLFGGYGADLLDVKPRSGDPDIYFEVAPGVDTDGLASTHNGADFIYGGWGPDELQADVGGTGPDPFSDHLIDWVGNHNVFYVCDGALGRGKVIRSPSPALYVLLADLAVASGATEIDSEGSGGWFELGLVRKGDNNQNSSPHPNAPGNFTCEGGAG